jgi:hypothetical protein
MEATGSPYRASPLAGVLVRLGRARSRYAARQVVRGPDILYDGPVNLSPARVVATLRAFAAAVKQISEGYAQGPPGC